MRRLVACLVTLLLAASAASAGNLNLRWNACWGDGGGANKAFACDANTGFSVLVGSFFVPYDVLDATGNEIVVDLATAGATLAPWWQFVNAGACRQGSLVINCVAPVTANNCVDWAAGSATGLLASYTTGFAGPSSARIRATTVAPALFDPLLAGTEYFSFNLVINHQKTVGTGSCSGCSLGACITLKALTVKTSDPRNDVEVRQADFQGVLDALATWQGGGGVISPIGTCPAATPTRDRTWGDVKALYR